jgi:hypothetical protein
MISALRAALHPLARDLDPEVLAFISDSLREQVATPEDAVEFLEPFLPSGEWARLSRAQRRLKGVAALAAVSGSAAGGAPEEDIMDALARQVAAASVDDRRRAVREGEAVPLEEADIAARRRVLSRFDEVAADSGGIVARAPGRAPDQLAAGGGGASVPAAAKKGDKRLAYVDGRPVYVSAREKFVVEKAPEPEPGTTVGPPAPVGAMLKIKKKGQGGASPGYIK